MRYKKSILMIIIILILLGAKSMFVVRSMRQQRSLEKSVEAFIEFLENGNIEDLNLRVCTRVELFLLPENVSNFIELEIKRLGHEDGTIVDSSTLSHYVELFKELKNTTLVPLGSKYKTEAPLNFIFETESDGILLEVGIWTFSPPSFLERITRGIISYESSRHIIVNGVAIKENQTLYDIVLPFLPEFAPLGFFGW